MSEEEEGGSEPRDTALLVQFEVYISHPLSGGPPLFAQDLLIMVVSGSKKKKKERFHDFLESDTILKSMLLLK